MKGTLKKIMTYLPLVISTIYFSACDTVVTSRKNLNHNSDQVKILDDILTSGNKITTSSSSGRRCQYRAKDFTLGDNKVTAHVVTFYAGRRTMDRDGRYEDKNGTFYDLLPNINFELIENDECGATITFISDNLESKIPADLSVRFKSTDGKFLIPDGELLNNAEQINGQGLYDSLITAYKSKFLK